MFREKQPTMKEILFPEREKIKMNFEHHQRNLRFIKDLEKANKEEKKIQEEIEKQKSLEFDFNNNNNENNVNNEENKIQHFKMKMFENVPSRYLKNTENWIFKQNKMRKLPPIKKFNFIHSKKNNKSNNVLFSNSNHKNNNISINYNSSNNNESLFEKYYVKMLKKNINYSNSQENLFYSQPIINNIGSYARKSNKKYLPPINIF